jgi:soluble lytic murein transglycosylase
VTRQRVVIGLGLLFLAFGLGGYAFWREWRDHRHDGVILAAAQRHGVDPALVKAVVWRESRFDARARGRAGEIGLMQITEAAALDWASANRVAPFDHETLLDPGTNTLAGAWLLARVLKRYANTDDPLPYALADYNAGRAHVLRWNRGDGATNSRVFLEQMTFPGTRNYIKAVTDRYARYQRSFRLPANPPAGR